MQQPQFQANNFLPFLQKHKKWLFILLGVGLIIGLIYLVGGILHNPEGILDDFEKAVKDGKVDQAQKMLNSEKKELVIDKKQVQQFIDHAKKDTAYFSELMSAMRAQYYFYDGKSEKAIDAPDDYLNFGDFYIARKEVPLFYDSYQVMVRPYYLTITTNETDAAVKIDGKEVFRTKEDNKKYTSEPMMPGKYDVLVEKNFEFAQLSNKQELHAFYPSKKEEQGKSHKIRKMDLELELKGEEIYLASKFEDTQVLINGQDSKKKVKDAKKFGPVSLNGSMKIQGKQTFPWGDEVSPEHVLKEEHKNRNIDLTPTLFSSAESRKKATELINTFLQSEMDTMISKDVNKFKNATDSMKKKAQEILASSAGHWVWKIKDKGKILDTKINYFGIEISYDSQRNLYSASLPIEIHYFASEQKDEPLKEKLEQYSVKLIYQEDSKSWIIDDKFEVTPGSDFMKSDQVVKTEFK